MFPNRYRHNPVELLVTPGVVGTANPDGATRERAVVEGHLPRIALLADQPQVGIHLGVTEHRAGVIQQPTDQADEQGSGKTRAEQGVAPPPALDVPWDPARSHVHLFRSITGLGRWFFAFRG